MKEQIMQKGFIQIPLLAEIITSIVIVSAMVYVGFEYHKVSELIKDADQLTEDERYEEAIEKLNLAQANLFAKALAGKKREVSHKKEKNKKLNEELSKYDQGLGKIDKGEYEEAIEIFSEIPEDSPYSDDTKLKIKEAEVKVKKEKPEKPEKKVKEDQSLEEGIASIDDLAYSEEIDPEASDPGPDSDVVSDNEESDSAGSSGRSRSILLRDHFPTVNSDSASTYENEKIEIDLASNDFDEEYDISLDSMRIIRHPKNGTANINEDNGVVDYNPNTGFIGEDTFEYLLCNSESRCGSAVVSVNVEMNIPDKSDEIVETSEIEPDKVSEQCVAYLTEYIRLWGDNNPEEVKKLQQFLVDYEGGDITVDGVYSLPIYDLVCEFQRKYAEDVLKPWGIVKPTGYVYKTTVGKINELYCKGQ